jgi:hypothetical protein
MSSNYDKDRDPSDIDELTEIFSNTNISTSRMTEEIGTKNSVIEPVISSTFNNQILEFTFDEREMIEAVNFDMKRPTKTTSKKARAKKSATIDVTPTLLDVLKIHFVSHSLVPQ